MHALFVACLLAGGVATALFLLLGFAGGVIGHASHDFHVGHNDVGALHGHGGVPHGHAGHDVTHGAHGAHVHDAHGSADIGHTPGRFGLSLGWAVSWLSPLAIAAAAIWFGGVGLVTEGSSLSLVFAVIAALVAATIVRTVMRAFVRASVPPLRLSGEGAIGKINAAILPNSTGEVLYTLEGLHRSAPARFEGNRTLPRGTDVVITRREAGIAWVEPLDPLADEPFNQTLPEEIGQKEGQSSSAD